MVSRVEGQDSARLYYEEIQLHHASQLQQALCDPLVYEFIDVRCPTLNELEDSFRLKEAGPPNSRADEQWIDYAAIRRDDGHAIGRLEATVIGKYAEVAYLFGSRFWGNGYATEGLQWLHQFLVNQFSVIDFWATVHPDNVRSLGLLNRLGYREAARETWPYLSSYDPGDRVFFVCCV